MKTFKNLCKFIHRYCGWVAGIVFFILCFTGCILVMQPEIERIAEPTRFVAPAHPGESPMTPGEFVATFEKLEAESFEDPTTVHVERLQTSSDPRKTWYALVSAKNDKRSWTYIAYADPVTGEGVSYGPSRTFGFFREVRGWHASLKIKSLGVLNKPVFWLSGDASGRGRVGGKVAGLFSLLVAVVLITGLVRWFPKWKNNKNLKNSFRPVLTRGKFRANYDLHNVGGFYAAALLLGLCLSGAWISVPWFRSACDKLVGYEEPQRAASAGSRGPRGPEGMRGGPGGRPSGMDRAPEEEDTTNYGAGILARRSPAFGGISHHTLDALMANTAFKCDAVLESTASLDEIVKEQQALVPSAKGFDIVLPETGSDRAITATRFGDFAGFCKPDVYYWDQYTGKLLGKTSFRDLPFGERFHSLIVPFHTGKIFGAASRYLLFLACFVGVILTITGYTLMTFRLLMKKKARQKKLAAEKEKAEETQG